MDRHALEEELLQHLQDVQHVLLHLMEGDRSVPVSEDLVKETIESIKSLSANFNESVKWIITTSQNLPSQQVRDL